MSTRGPRWLGILALLLAWLLIWPACMSFQRDGWDPKWGEDETEGDSFAGEEPPPEEAKAKAKAKDPDAEVEKAMEQVESELAADAEKKPEPSVAEPEPDPGIVAIPPPIEGIPTPELVPDGDENSGGALQPEEPPAVDDTKKKEDGGEEDLDAADAGDVG